MRHRGSREGKCDGLVLFNGQWLKSAAPVASKMFNTRGTRDTLGAKISLNPGGYVAWLTDYLLHHPWRGVIHPRRVRQSVVVGPVVYLHNEHAHMVEKENNANKSHGCLCSFYI